MMERVAHEQARAGQNRAGSDAHGTETHSPILGPMANPSEGLMDGPRPSRMRRWSWVALMFVLGACLGEGSVEIRGTIVSAADRTPVSGAEVRMYFDNPNLWTQTCDQLQQPFSVVRSDQTGYFKTASTMYPASCIASPSCKQGVLCISQPGFATKRLEFDDCDRNALVDEDGVVIELTPQ